MYPVLPGCVATGVTPEAVLAEIREAIAFHIESLRQHGEPMPEPQSTAEVVNVDTVSFDRRALWPVWRFTRCRLTRDCALTWAPESVGYRSRLRAVWGENWRYR